MNTLTKVLMFLTVLAFGCAGGDEYYATGELDAGKEIGVSAQPISVIASYGVAYTPNDVSNNNGRCRALSNGANELCAYPPSKTVIAYVAGNNWSSDDKNLMKSWVDTATGELNAVTSTWSAARTGSISDNPTVYIQRGFIQRHNGGGNGTVMSIAKAACLHLGPLLAEEQSGSHRLCNRWTVTVDTDNIRFFSAPPFGDGSYAQMSRLFRHAASHAVNVGAGIGWQNDFTINGVNHQNLVNALNLNPVVDKAGFAPRDVCRADAYSSSNPLLLVQAGGCP